MYVSVFPVENKNYIKIRITHSRVTGDGCNWEEMSLMNVCTPSQSVLHQVLNAVLNDFFFFFLINRKICFI